ncbi:MAG: hypothetical protein CMA06_01650 [Euryarchaeota archaeon]|nr:hypothetical protein [Euryarchaeota archaeon]
MLVKGIIPDTEPTISVGLVLPIDKQKSVYISSNFDDKKYKIKIMKGRLLVNGEIKTQLLLERVSNESIFNLEPITAGRGFHWQKKINISINGSLKIMIINDNLFIVNEIGLESYLMSVATSEMSGECPIALLEAQTIAARSWIIASEEQKHKDLDIDVCNDDCCQRYQGTQNISELAQLAVRKTRGVFVTYDNEICDTRYSKSCGGISENNENVWNDVPKSYLRGVFDGKKIKQPDFSKENELKDWFLKPQECFCNNHHVNENELKKYLGSVDEEGEYFRWRVSYSPHELMDMINTNLSESFDSIDELIPLKRGVSGRITKLEIRGKKNDSTYKIIIDNEYDIRDALHPKFLYSSAFIINANSNAQSAGEKLTLSGAGWGHGVGLCQIGALGMALIGKSSEEILKHYFSVITIKKFYD